MASNAASISIRSCASTGASRVFSRRNRCRWETRFSRAIRFSSIRERVPLRPASPVATWRARVGGYTWLELGRIFGRLGSRITVIHRSEQILGQEDADIAVSLQKAL